MIPRRLSPQPLSGWRDYDQLASAPAGPFTTPASDKVRLLAVPVESTCEER